MNKLVRESVLLAIAAAPAVFLAGIYTSLPDEVPVHFGLDGRADDWARRSFVWWIAAVPNLFVYFVFLVVPVLDPKKKISHMGSKYQGLRFIVNGFFAIFSIYMLQVIRSNTDMSPNVMVALFGMLLTGLGNYMQTVRPNYFIGLRTPWTLESEEVWRRTHRLSGRLMMGAGVISLFAAWAISSPALLMAVLFTGIGVAILFPALMSFVLFRRLHDSKKP